MLEYLVAVILTWGERKPEPVYFDLDTSPTLSLLHKRHAAVFLSFFHKVYRGAQADAVPEERLESWWEAFIENEVAQNDWEGEAPANSSKFYMEDWLPHLGPLRLASPRSPAARRQRDRQQAPLPRGGPDRRYDPSVHAGDSRPKEASSGGQQDHQPPRRDRCPAQIGQPLRGHGQGAWAKLRRS